MTRPKLSRRTLNNAIAWVIFVVIVVAIHVIDSPLLDTAADLVVAAVCAYAVVLAVRLYRGTLPASERATAAMLFGIVCFGAFLNQITEVFNR